MELQTQINTEVEQIEAVLLQFPQIECPVTHHFAPGVYTREALMPAGTFVVGHEHKTEHLNVMLTGKARVMVDGVVRDLCAPAILTSKAGTRKLAYIVEDVRWLTIHPTNETDPDKLFDSLAIKSESFLKHELEALSGLSNGVN